MSVAVYVRSPSEAQRASELFRVRTDKRRPEAAASEILRVAMKLMESPLVWFAIDGRRGERVLATCSTPERVGRIDGHLAAAVPLEPSDSGVLHAFAAGRSFGAFDLEVAYLAAGRIAADITARRQGWSVRWCDDGGLLTTPALAAVTGLMARRALVLHEPFAILVFPKDVPIRPAADVLGRFDDGSFVAVVPLEEVNRLRRCSPHCATLVSRGALHGAPLLQAAAALLARPC